jgi:hypothetical protein
MPVEYLTEHRRIATLVSFVRQLAVTAQDDSLDVLDMLVRDLLARSVSSGKKARLRISRTWRKKNVLVWQAHQWMLSQQTGNGMLLLLDKRWTVVSTHSAF